MQQFLERVMKVQKRRIEKSSGFEEPTLQLSEYCENIDNYRTLP